MEAYKHWLCASTLPFYLEGHTVRPCSTFCQQVEAMCPFFRPKVDTHEGDPSFICKDPEIEGDPVHYHYLQSRVGGGGSRGRQGSVEDVQDFPCFQLCHVVSPATITRTFCPGNSSRCADLGRELHDCPPLQLPRAAVTTPAAADSANRTAANATSSASGSVHRFSGHMTRTTLLLCWVVVVVVEGVAGGGGGGRDRVLLPGGGGGGGAGVWLRCAAFVWLLWLALTLSPYSCIGLT